MGHVTGHQRQRELKQTSQQPGGCSRDAQVFNNLSIPFPLIPKPKVTCSIQVGGTTLYASSNA